MLSNLKSGQFIKNKLHTGYLHNTKIALIVRIVLQV